MTGRQHETARRCRQPHSAHEAIAELDWGGGAQQELLYACRYPSFGHGILELLSPTEARWTWHANQDNVAVASDQLNITRSLACPNQQR